ncbi:hypothetical protein JW859_07635 [bacterium]|nr:hypothetical protein [bacterium]
MRKALIIMLFAILAATPVWAQDDPNERGSGAISIDDLEDSINVCTTVFEGIAVFYILPKGWEGAEQGVDRKSGVLDEELNRYVMMSRRPLVEGDDTEDFVFELSIYRYGIPTDWGEEVTPEERAELEESAFWDFINMQMSESIKSGMDCVSPAESIKAKPYGVGTRKPTYFVPVFYRLDDQLNIYTFTSVTAGKIWTVKFLVEADQAENYEALIALILNNSFAMTEAQFAEYQAQYGKEVPERER